LLDTPFVLGTVPRRVPLELHRELFAIGEHLSVGFGLMQVGYYALLRSFGR
jgi:hypothetical protein